MKKILQIKEKVHSEFLPYIPKKLHKRFLVGIQAFSLQRFVSINSNGRSTSNNRNTGESRTYRLTHELRFPALIAKISAGFINRRSGEVRMSLDFSTVHPLQVVCLAVTTGKGRALPIWLKAYPKKPKPGTVIFSLIRGLDAFLAQVKDVGRIVIALDRWFVSPRLLRYLDSKGITFIVRIKSCQNLEVPWEDEPVQAGEISNEGTWVRYTGLDLRLIRSSWTEEMKEEEPWFLLTNCQSLSRRQVINRYVKRFEIEEYFKDLKWIQGYEWHLIKYPLVLEVVLWFVILGWWLVKEVLWSEVLASRSRRIHPKKRLSFFRTCWEVLHAEMCPDVFRLVPT